MTDPRFYLVIDLEATTSDDGSLPPEHMETIEIGAVLADAQTLAVVAEFQHGSLTRTSSHKKSYVNKYLAAAIASRRQRGRGASSCPADAL